MIAQNIPDKNLIEYSLNDRERTFCKLMIPGTKTATQAYIESGYAPIGASANSSRLMAKDKIKTEIHRLRIELAEKEGITQAVQCRKLEDLRLRCKETNDSTGENAAIREQNKLYGLSIDKTETSDAQKARTAKEKAIDKEFAAFLLEGQRRADRALVGDNTD